MRKLFLLLLLQCFTLSVFADNSSIALGKAIEVVDADNVNKYAIELHATVNALENYSGVFKVSICGGKRYATVIGSFSSKTYILAAGSTTDIVIRGSMAELEDSTKYKVYLQDSNGAYFAGQGSLDNAYILTGKDMTRPEDWVDDQDNTGDNEDPGEGQTYTGDYMLTTQWGQDAPYHNLCPSMYPTGCTATATAQVLRYYKYPVKGTGSITYTDSNGNTRTLDFSQETFQWDAMPDKLTNGSPDSCKTAVATLMRAVGYASQMKYANDESVAYIFNAGYGIATYLNYDKSACYVMRKMYTDDEWNELIQSEILAGRPVVYSGYASETSGHTFVLDGYKDGKYHVNYGWDGLGDGWYTLDNIQWGYNQNQEALIGIRPYAGTANFATVLYNFADFSVDAEKSAAGNFTFRGEFANRSVEEKTFRYGVEFVDAAETSTFVESTVDNTRAPLGYYGNFKVQPSLMPKTDGKYLVYPAYRDSERKWHRMRTDHSKRQALLATIEGGNITFSTDVDAIEDVPFENRVDEAYYALDGRRLSGIPQHGVYIHHGKKYIAR